MERIALVNPAYDYPVTRSRKLPRWNRIWPPLDLANAAAMLRQEGFEPVLVDANAERIDAGEVASRVAGCAKIFITSASLDRWQCPHVDIRGFVETVRAVKAANAQAKVYVMGPHGTSRPSDIWKMTMPDGIIVGEPELAIIDVCKSVRQSCIEGMYVETPGGIAFVPRKKFLDLNELPMPAFDLLPMEKYSYEILGDHFALFEASRGCPHSCTFCSAKQMYGPQYRIKSADRLADEVERAVKELGVRNAYFIDLEFTMDSEANRANVERLCELLVERKLGLKWACQTRADAVDEVLLKKMKEAGCEVVHFGVETGSQKVLESINKRVTFKQVEAAVRAAERAGMRTVAFFMFGLPGESEADMDETIEFAKKLNPTYASFNVATPYPGTAFFESVKDSLEGVFPACYEGVLTAAELKDKTKAALMKFYLRPSYMLKQLSSGDVKRLKDQAKLFIDMLR
ncbi:MAG: radical SAM protein [Candidatus Aenigmarchaeota archaeon]|nr:radical SAM protein [Candidatus Aenigmarchaeota archaeon]